jgi:DNA-binding transcriptional LysR family regulator
VVRYCGQVSALRTLKVGFVPGTTPGKWIRRWEERMPEVPLEAFPVSETEQVAVLHSGVADLALVRLPLDRSGLNLIPLYAERPVVVAPKDHEIAVFDEVPVAELSAEHLLQDPDSVPEWRDIAEEVRNGSRKPLPDMANLEEGLDLVAAGLGILILPMSVARQQNRKDLRARPVLGIAEFQVGLAWPADTSDEVIEEFIGVVRGRSANSSRQPSVQAAQDAAPKKGRRAPAGKSSGGTSGGGTSGGAKTSGGKTSGGKGARSSGGGAGRTGGSGAAGKSGRKPGSKGGNARRGR